MILHYNSGRVPDNDWIIDRSVPPKRRLRLLEGPNFENIVLNICRNLTVCDHKRERHDTRKEFFRFLVVLRLDSRMVDQFHNSSSGYRAQYFLSESMGEEANRFACARIGESVFANLQSRLKRTCNPDWVTKSLSDLGSKLWIYQGLWLRHAKRSDRDLTVLRWEANAANPMETNAGKLARGSTLMPNSETQIVLKGGFLTKPGRKLGKHKVTRSRDLHKLGFT